MKNPLLIALIFYCSNGIAGIFESNIYMGYPDHKCHKPYKPSTFTDNMAVQMYNTEVELYADCVADYVKRAQNDVEDIQAKVKKLIKDAESPY